MNKIVCIVGPTAVGKTALAIDLARELDGEIISCDSMQIYRGMDIGTAKPTKGELDLVKHHLIDIKNPDEDFSCADYATLAKEAINDIVSRGKTPIFCGGTGLYLDSVIEIESFSSGVKDEEYRKELEIYAREHGAEALHNMLREIDPESAEATHMNNIKRVIRALEIYKCTGIKKSQWDKESKTGKAPYDATVIFLTCKDREILYSRIEKRVDIMLSEGLLEEARRLFEGGYLREGLTASSAIGYKELIPYFKGEATLDACIERLKISTRQYAKRQLTWFTKKNYHTIYVDEESPREEALRLLQK
jgi:tRNA dimethylallyltransferase